MIETREIFTESDEEERYKEYIDLQLQKWKELNECRLMNDMMNELFKQLRFNHKEFAYMSRITIWNILMRAGYSPTYKPGSSYEELKIKLGDKDFKRFWSYQICQNTSRFVEISIEDRYLNSIKGEEFKLSLNRVNEMWTRIQDYEYQ